MKQEKIKRERYSLFYGNGETYGTIGSIECEFYHGDYDTLWEASMAMGFAQTSEKGIWSYIYDNKKKDFHSYTGNFKG